MNESLGSCRLIHCVVQNLDGAIVEGWTEYADKPDYWNESVVVSRPGHGDEHFIQTKVAGGISILTYLVREALMEYRRRVKEANREPDKEPEPEYRLDGNERSIPLWVVMKPDGKVAAIAINRYAAWILASDNEDFCISDHEIGELMAKGFTERLVPFAQVEDR